jgi:long-chain acyl-CoA synthetase
MLTQTAYSVNMKLGAVPLGEGDTYISYLPAAHSFEQAVFACTLIYGMKCGFYGGDPLKMIAEDLPTLKPTFFPSVPRLYNRIYGKIKDSFS